MNRQKQIWYERDIDPSPLAGRIVAVVGYGAQGRSHALNLRDSGVSVGVGQRPGPGAERARADGFQPVSVAEAARQAAVVCLMLPDEQHGPVFDAEIRPVLQPGTVILCCHGFSLLYGQVVPPEGIASILVAPKGAGHMVRTAYENGGGVPCLVAAGPGSRRDVHLPLALAYARALGGGRAGVMETTIAEETETDLFGEQAVLCGGVSHLAAAAFETLVEAGYQEEIAWFECVYELKLVVDLLHKGGLAYMRDHISNTAEYGDYTRGPRIVDGHVRDRMREILAEIRSGDFAREWINESRKGGRNFEEMRARHRQQPVELAGQRVFELLGMGRTPGNRP
jgi:ketol-acid reductoisomerase